jgi:hypothetical protein
VQNGEKCALFWCIAALFRGVGANSDVAARIRKWPGVTIQLLTFGNLNCSQNVFHTVQYAQHFPAAMHEDDSCLQIPHQLKQFLTMLPSKYFGLFVSNKRHFDRNQVFPRALAQYFLFLLSNFLLKSAENCASDGPHA